MKTKNKYKKYKWSVESNWSSRKRSWRQEIVDVGSGSACGEYSHCWSCRSFSLTFETWHKQLHTNKFLSGFLADYVLLNWNPSQRKEAMSQGVLEMVVSVAVGKG